MQTLTRLEPCLCTLGGDCGHVTACRMQAAVEAEAEEWARKVEALEAENARLKRALSRRRVYPTEAVANAFWEYWRENGETHKHGYYESTWGAINAALAASDVEALR